MLCKRLKHAVQHCQSCLVCLKLLGSKSLSVACMPPLHTCRQWRYRGLESFQFCKSVKVPRLVTYGAGMPGTAVLLQGSDKDFKSCTWTYREKKTEKSGSKATLFLPSGEKYCGSWQHNKREGSGTVVYPNKDKYEGEWLNGKRHGIGALWLYDSDRYRICYTGEWQKDKFHGRGIYYDDAGNAYEGLWEKGVRKGRGQQAYLSEPGNSSDVYDGDWELDNRSGTGTMRYANGDIFEGQWANDMKNGPGVYYYADGAVYEGVWQEDIAKCGCYRQATESEEQQPGALPALQLENAQLVLADAEDSLPPVVYY